MQIHEQTVYNAFARLLYIENFTHTLRSSSVARRWTVQHKMRNRDKKKKKDGKDAADKKRDELDDKALDARLEIAADMAAGGADCSAGCSAGFITREISSKQIRAEQVSAG